MDSELAQRRLQNRRRNQELTQLIDKQRDHQKEALAKNDNIIELINMELENLRLQFQNEEVREPNPTELRGANKVTGCCCLILQQESFMPVSSNSKELSNYLTVKSTGEFYGKKAELEKRQDELGSCKCGCCHCIASLFARDVSKKLEDFCFVMGFYFGMLWLLYLLMAVFLLPVLWIYRCFQALWACCYRRGSRSQRVLAIYQKYSADIENVHTT